ncbi:DEAD/DEAH box helicase [Ruminococcaceae bacterium OttesenSCG-928-L11]|nr:DEAD/DEAH box helicase [Ruminococcaceae bacterium OttesenSCG-928-L11]
MTPFYVLYTATKLRSLADADRLLPALSSANMEVYPFQIAAAMFALRSPYLKGAILADEGSLGKTYEALLVISQLWYEGKEKILLVVPTPLLRQWQGILDDCFSMPYITLEGDIIDIDIEGTIALTTYDCAAANLDAISAVAWDVTMFDEAHRLAKCYEPGSRAAKLKTAVGDAYKLLVTASPMRNSIMDLYGLIFFIDEHAFEEPDTFYKRYFRKPENYHELSNRASYYAFRTLRTQVESYVKIPHRLVVTADYPQTKQEKQLATLLCVYLKKRDKLAFPKMDEWELTLMMNRALASSPYAFCGLLDSAVGRVREPELIEMTMLAADIEPDDTHKGKTLLKSLKLAFAELKKRGANRKAIIFTENRSTLGFLHKLLCDTYKTLAFDGSKSGDFSVIQRFESEAEILITTDVAAEGFNLQFCSFVVNYDLPYNTQTLQQRIMRCHRQGQQNDVVVLNFLSKTNIADVRTLELINKRTVQFDGIVGESDDVIGSFSDSAAEGLQSAFTRARTRAEIEADFHSTLTQNEESNAALVENAENTLFTTFTKEISDKIIITPQYAKNKTAEIDAMLWDVTTHFFENFACDDCRFEIDRQTQTINAITDGELPHLFYYWTGSRNKPYTSLAKYGMAKDFKPAKGRITPTSVIGRGVISETAFASSGTVEVDATIPPCEIGFYNVSIRAGTTRLADYTVFAGKTDGGAVLSDTQCREIMDLPVRTFTEDGSRSLLWLRESTGTPMPHSLDKLVDTSPLIRRAATESENERKDEIERLSERARLRKLSLTRDIERMKREIKQAGIDKGGSISDQINVEKHRAAMTREVKKREQSVFLDGFRIDTELEDEIGKLTAGLTAKTMRLFAIRVEGFNREIL